MKTSIQFLGAARTVTGSKHLLTFGDKKVLIDCGMFQGSRELNARNWLPFGFEPNELDAVVITHAHQDHIGLLPRLVREGYTGPIYATAATIALAKISLPDSGRIQEEDARFANKHQISGHNPALPLFTEQDAYECQKQFVKVGYYQMHDLPGAAKWQFKPAGHILGSTFAEVYFQNGERIIMGGDLGRYDTPIIKDPAVQDSGEYLVLESTYGDRLHSQENVHEKLEQILNDAFKNGSVVLTPSFAIGRTQELLYAIHKLQDENRIPRIPIYVDSPMATSTTEVYARIAEEYDQDMQAELNMGHTPLEPENLTFIRDKEQSKALNSMRGPMMVIAGSGMCNGGRIVHHLLQRLGDPSTVVLFTGYQGSGTLGRMLVDGKEIVHIHRQEIHVRAKVDRLNALSAHADQGEIMRWLGGFKSAPRKTFIVHGEPPAQEVLANKIRADLGWDVVIPEYAETHEL